MTMAMMVTSSPEDISNLTTTIKLIKLIQNMLGDHATYIEYGDSKINDTEIQHISDYFNGMYHHYDSLLHPHSLEFLTTLLKNAAGGAGIGTKDGGNILSF